MIYATNGYVAKRLCDLARGKYQLTLATGDARVSGSDIQNRWAASYAQSRRSFLTRIEHEGFEIRDYSVAGRRFLVVGTTDEEVDAVTDDQLMDAWV